MKTKSIFFENSEKYAYHKKTFRKLLKKSKILGFQLFLKKIEMF